MEQNNKPVKQEPVTAMKKPNVPTIAADVHAALCFALWHHQGGSSSIGQPIREMLGLGQHDHMTSEQYFAAKRVAEALAEQDHFAASGKLITEQDHVEQSLTMVAEPDTKAGELHAMKTELWKTEAQEPVAKYSDIASNGGLDPRNAALMGIKFDELAK